MSERVFTEKQLELIEKHRDWNVDDSSEWWDGVYENWVEKLEALGIDVDKKPTKLMNGKTRYDPAIHFSGFWSQGDGACFEGRLRIKKFIAAHNMAGDYPAVKFVADYGDVGCSIEHSGSYCHSNSVRYEFTADTDFEADDPIREAIREHMVERFDGGEFSEFEESVKEICRGYMDDIYDDLEKEYDYLTSDEVVWAAIEANELDKEDEEDEEDLAEAA